MRTIKMTVSTHDDLEGLYTFFTRWLFPYVRLEDDTLMVSCFRFRLVFSVV